MGRKRNRDTGSTGPAETRRAARAAPGRQFKPATGSKSGPASGAKPKTDPWLIAAGCAVLLLSTFLAFRPALDKDFGFVNLDDNRYVYENVHVVQGLTRESAAWAFKSLEYDNWHPLTWLSHMLDRQIFGAESLQHPWGYHLTNVILHAANVVLLFVVLARMTAQPWPSMAVAVLFGIHPLRAESVAWISERKDVLSGLFFILTIWAYAAYATHGRSWGRYLLVIELYVLGLMAKPMLVTLPVLLLLLDYWPLRRIASPTLPLSPSPPPTFLALILEKLPLFVLAAASCAVTVIAQQGAMKVIDTTTFAMRVQNAIVSLAIYIGQIFCPIRLSPMYPFPEHGIPWPEIVLSVIVLVGITLAVVWQRNWRWLTVGWLWYLIAVFPVLGIVQVGVQARADRYTYLPHIGLYIMLAWTADKLMARWPLRPLAWAAGLVVLLPILVNATAAQTSVWKDSETLLTSALKANPDTAIAHNNLSYIVQTQGKLDEAFDHYLRATQIRPRYVEAHINLGNMYVNRSQAAKARGQTDQSSQLLDKALAEYRTAIDIRPDYEMSYANLGAALIIRGNLPAAEEALRQALQIDPHYVDAHWKLGEVFRQQKKVDAAIAEYRAAIQDNPQFFPAWMSMGDVLYGQGKLDEARKCEEVVLQDPSSANEARRMLGYLHYLMHQPKQALTYWTQYLDSNPDSLPVLTIAAWLLATDPDPSVRNANQALALAQRAAKIANGKDPQVLVALAAAMAESGDFSQATRTAQEAQYLRGSSLSPAEMLELLGKYQSGNRFVDEKSRLLLPAATGTGK